MDSEKRIDSDDGIAYTFDEFVAFYTGKIKMPAIKKYWASCPVASTAKPKGRSRRRGRGGVKAGSVPQDATLCVEVQAPSAGSGSDKDVRAEVEPKAERPQPPPFRRSRSWLVKAGGVTVLPCEEKLVPLLEEYAALREAADYDGMEALQFKLLQEHPFVDTQNVEVMPEALAAGVSCKVCNLRMNVGKFRKWLRSAEGKPFEEKGAGYDDGCYLTSAVLRSMMPRGYTHFTFSNGSGESSTVVLRGFFKFTGLAATDEDEESRATAEVDAFMFNGYKRQDASRFAVTTKSNGENGKYMVRQIFGEWYCFAGSKMTGKLWQLGSKAEELYPVPKYTGNDSAQVGPKIIAHVEGILSQMSADNKQGFLEAVNASRLTIMFEFNDPTHEHIFPIESTCADHVALLSRQGYPLPQGEARAFFDKFGLRRVSCQVYDDMNLLEGVMEEIRASTEIEGAVIYLERADMPVGMVKIKSNYYVIARRTRETMRSALVNPVLKGTSVKEAMATTSRRLKEGMRTLTHVGGHKEHHKEWADFAVTFAESWANAYSVGDEKARAELVSEFSSRYGSLYYRFYRQRQGEQAGDDAAT
mmetsp:Transcript_25597/g.56445  ORF Transcript_25597/g.56445 Transcript_25597/m.56445 type:complete len:586 (+) Transcript_25597:54-1811(+)